jgi:hypothetical protein
VTTEATHNRFTTPHHPQPPTELKTMTTATATATLKTYKLQRLNYAGAPGTNGMKALWTKADCEPMEIRATDIDSALMQVSRGICADGHSFAYPARLKNGGWLISIAYDGALEMYAFALTDPIRAK